MASSSQDVASAARDLLATARKAADGTERAGAVRNASLLLLGSGASNLQELVPALTEFLVRAAGAPPRPAARP